MSSCSSRSSSPSPTSMNNVALLAYSSGGRRRPKKNVFKKVLFYGFTLAKVTFFVFLALFALSVIYDVASTRCREISTYKNKKAEYKKRFIQNCNQENINKFPVLVGECQNLKRKMEETPEYTKLVPLFGQAVGSFITKTVEHLSLNAIFFILVLLLSATALIRKFVH